MRAVNAKHGAGENQFGVNLGKLRGPRIFKRGSASSADLLGERDEDALRATDITEPIAVLVLHQLANQFGTVGAEPGNDIIDVFDGEHDAPYAWVFGGALFGSALSAVGLRNFVSSTRPWPSGVRIIAMSDRTPSSPMRRSTERPSTCASPSNSRPSSLKKATAAARSSTTTPTLSIRLSVMPLSIPTADLVERRGRQLRFVDEIPA